MAYTKKYCVILDAPTLMKSVDLFGELSEVPDGKPQRGWLAVKRSMGYREAETKAQRCKTCIHLVKKEFANTYYKCQLMKPESASQTNDIRLKMVCNHFEEDKHGLNEYR